MPYDEHMLKNRFEELAARASERGCYTYSEFLTPAEQDTLWRMRLSVPVEMKGGYFAAERKLACFGSLELCGYEETLPICCICIAPTSKKFADELTHRDFLGSLMGLGIRRALIGDIIIVDNRGYLLCLETIADYIAEQLMQVKHTTVTCTRVSGPPEIIEQLPEISQIIVASERIDAVVAAVYKLSRAECQRLFEQDKVFTNSRLQEKYTYTPLRNDVISVRGFGRFIYEGVERETHKGRLRANVRIF